MSNWTKVKEATLQVPGEGDGVITDPREKRPAFFSPAGITETMRRLHEMRKCRYADDIGIYILLGDVMVSYIYCDLYQH